MVGYGKTEDGGNPEWVKGGTMPKEIKGGIGCLRYLAVNDAKYPEYNYSSLLVDPSSPLTSEWKNRTDVKVWWRDGHSGNLGGAIRKGDLGPPFQGGNSGWFGPEFAFGQVIGDHYQSNDVLIIKAAWGGRSLAKDFRPPSAVAKRGGEVGEFYKATLDNVNEVLSNLDTEFPEWKGKGYQIVGIGWHQGFNDRVTKEFSPEYKDNLPDLIHDLRAAFKKPNLPFVIASTGMGNAGPLEGPPFSGYTEVEKAQLWVAGVNRPDKVLSFDTRVFWQEPEKSPSTQGHHWNHSGESYFLIGKVMADHMLKLLKQ
jgi:Carbohydrate esterase, sialic acid-specific acetylesterase